ncbi:MAG: helix-turn-helix domain-containing protein [Synergistaceae bacterium]|nr:helix-turn-helix domain-containing protein [Synergistaceae bacterium]
MSISANIRQLRKKAGLTQIELAEKLEVSIATLRRWEAGETAPNGTRIVEMADILGVAPDEIVAGDGNNPIRVSSRILLPASENSGGMLVFEGEGTRIELPPTDKGYELFARLIENLIKGRKASTEDPGLPRP